MIGIFQELTVRGIQWYYFCNDTATLGRVESTLLFHSSVSLRKETCVYLEILVLTKVDILVRSYSP